MFDKDLYEILGVKKDSNEAEVRKAFHRLAKKYHPDVNPNNKDAETKFKEVNLAYEVLKDSKKRAQYDQMRAAGANPFGGGFGGGPRAGGGWPPGAGQGGAEFFSDFGLGDIFQEIFGGGFAGARDPRRPGTPLRRKGGDQNTSLSITFLEAARGSERTLEFTDGRKLAVRIPEGVEDGAKIKLTGQGEPGAGGGPAGDLIVALSVAPHEYFQRESQNIVVRVPVTFSEAVLGGEIDVPTLDGKVVMKVPPGVSSGQRLKLSGKGIRGKDGKKGDQFVELLIRVPKPIPESYQRAATELKEENYQPRTELFRN